MKPQPVWPRIVGKLKRLAYSPLDTYDLIAGNRPPDKMIFIGDGSWRAVGNEFLRHFKKLGGLQPHHRVLDVGCGIGRMAFPLTRYLSSQGRYSGFDIVRSGIDWCQQNITPHHPNFSFLHSNVLNKHYNPSGTELAAKYVFPYDDGSFDFVFLTSVFTHMVPADMENYLCEIARVLSSGGHCLITFFLINESSRNLIGKGMATFRFQQVGNYFVADLNDHEAAIAFDESYIKQLFREYRLDIVQPIHYGSWSGRSQYTSFQDIVVGRKA